MSLLSWLRVYGSGRRPHSTTSSDSPGTLYISDGGNNKVPKLPAG
jgi:hypothetical protein